MTIERSDSGAVAGIAQERRYVKGFTTYLFQQDLQGDWTFIEQRKLLGLFRRPDWIHPLKNYKHAEIRRWWEDDGIELRDIHLHSHEGKAVLICVYPDDRELAWFEESLEATGIPIRQS